MLGEVGFVEGDDDMLAHEVDIGFLPGCRGVVDEKDDVGVGDGLACALDAEGLDAVVAVAEAGGVDEAEGDAVESQCLLDGVTRGARNIGDDGTVVAQQGVEKRRLAGIGTADDGHGDAPLEGIAHLER